MKTKKMILVSILAVLFLNSLAACNIRLSLNGTEDMAKHMAAGIADIQPPKGFRAVFSGTYNEYTVVAYNSKDKEHSHLYLIQSSDPDDLDVFQQELESMMPDKLGVESEFTVIESRELTIRDADAMLVLTEGINADGETYRQVVVFFAGIGGPAALVFSELESDWDDERAEKLVSSIR
ncbi:MAG: hypothetical protein HPY85_15125 [Anaerolineae bacterium]|jgi:hypothetical protein|nr:hypothetical protein [Anaerolineae bacterium]